MWLGGLANEAPENMILKRLRNANVIPVVILEPKDFDSKHFAFDLLKRAGRCSGTKDSWVALISKCLELVELRLAICQSLVEHRQNIREDFAEFLYNTSMPQVASNSFSLHSVTCDRKL